MKKTLLQKAKEIKVGDSWKGVNDETVELALEWLKGEIRYTQIKDVMGVEGSNIYNFLARNLKEAYNRKKIKIEKLGFKK